MNGSFSVLFFSLFLFALCLFLKAKLGVEYLLSEADGFGGDLNKLILSDKLDGLLKAHDLGRNQTQSFIRAGGSDGGQVLFLANI